MARPPVTLLDLIGTVSVDQFIEAHWLAERPLVARASEALLDGLGAIAGLGSPAELLARHRRDVRLFGPDAFRSTVPPGSALDFLPRGYNVYVTHVQETVPEAHAFMLGIAQDLGAAPWDVRLEAFAGSDGAVSSRHYDHDMNFQVLLRGEKVWEIEANRDIRNPLAAFHPTPAAPSPVDVHAVDPAAPARFERSERHHLRAGDVLFLPRGWWHEVTSLGETWAVNLVVRGAPLASCVAEALGARLLATAEFRTFVATLPGGVQDGQQALLASLKQAAARELAQISLEEASLASVADVYEFTTRDRRVEGGALQLPGLAPPQPVDPDVGAALTALFRFRGPFTLLQALAATGYANPIGVYNLLMQLADLGALARR